MEPPGRMSFGNLGREPRAGRQQQMLFRRKQRRIQHGANLLSPLGMRGVYRAKQTGVHQAFTRQRSAHPFQVDCADGSASEGKRRLQDRVEPCSARHPLGMPGKLHHRELLEPFKLSWSLEGACQTVRTGIQLIADLLFDLLPRRFLPGGALLRLRGLTAFLWLEFDREIYRALAGRGRFLEAARRELQARRSLPWLYAAA